MNVNWMENELENLDECGTNDTVVDLINEMVLCKNQNNKYWEFSSSESSSSNSEILMRRKIS